MSNHQEKIDLLTTDIEKSGQEINTLKQKRIDKKSSEIDLMKEEDLRKLSTNQKQELNNLIRIQSISNETVTDFKPGA